MSATGTPSKKRKTSSSARRWAEEFQKKVESLTGMAADFLHRTFMKGQDAFVQHLINEKLVTEAAANDEATAILEGWQQFFQAKTNEWAAFWDSQKLIIPLDEWEKLFSNDKFDWFLAAKQTFPDKCPEAALPYAAAGWKQFIDNEPLTVAQALGKLSPDSDDSASLSTGLGIQNIQTEVSGVHGRAYYIPGGPVNFRHEGISWKRPKKLLLRSLSSRQYESKVLVFYSASGSGKTVELAGSAVSRDAHLTVVLMPRDYADWADKELGADEVPGQHTVRQIEKFTLLRNEMEAVVLENKNAFTMLTDAATREKISLKLVIAIDEASQCPKMVRSIIREPEIAAGIIKDVFHNHFIGEKAQLLVQFSVAGTGASAATAGSLVSNFEVVQPTCADNVMLRNSLLRGLPDLLAPGSGGERKSLATCIDEHLPVVAVMMENGRMASIAWLH